MPKETKKEPFFRKFPLCQRCRNSGFRFVQYVHQNEGTESLRRQLRRASSVNIIYLSVRARMAFVKKEQKMLLLLVESRKVSLFE